MSLMVGCSWEEGLSVGFISFFLLISILLLTNEKLLFEQ